MFKWISRLFYIMYRKITSNPVLDKMVVENYFKETVTDKWVHIYMDLKGVYYTSRSLWDRCCIRIPNGADIIKNILWMQENYSQTEVDKMKGYNKILDQFLDNAKHTKIVTE